LPAGTVGGTGCIATGAGTNVTYSGGTLGAGVVGNIADLVSPGGIVGDFMTFQGTRLDFVLDGFTTPTTTNGTNCAGTTTGQTCVVFAGSPFLLVNLGSGDTLVALTAFGTILDGGFISNWSGSFTTQLTETPGAIQAAELGGGSITSTQSAQFVVTVTLPPPSPPTANCASINAVAGVAIFPITVTGSGGAGGPYTFSATGLPPGLTMSSGGTISGTPTVSGTFPYTVTVTDSAGNTGTVSCSITVLSSPPPPASCFFVSYAANLSVGESYINLINTGAAGAPVLGPGFGAPVGNICVNVYAFDPQEEEISCCSCLLTPNQIANLGVNGDLISNTQTGENPASVVIKLVCTLAGGDGTGTSCNQNAAVQGFQTPSLAALGTTVQPAGTKYSVVEHVFVPSTLSASEYASITGRCAAIMGNGSGYGICHSCQLGAMGATKH
jgi:hypothetical protein